MKRRLVTTVAVLSLLLATLVLVDWCTHPWYRNLYICRVPRIVDADRISHHCTVQTGSGLVIFLYIIERQAASEAKVEPTFQWSSGAAGGLDVLPDTRLGRLGFGTLANSFIASAWPTTITVTQNALIVPCWFLLLLFLILPAIWLWRFRNRIPLGHCRVCGYDLRASPERCPECGAQIKLENQPQILRARAP